MIGVVTEHEYKRLTPCIYDCMEGKAVRWFDDRDSDWQIDVVELARQYSEHGADELLIFDLSRFR